MKKPLYLAVLVFVTSNAAAHKKPDLPLEGTREFKLTTETVSWRSLDVSRADGTLVFDVLGDLYTVPSEGGAAQRITSGMAFDSQPRFSPDGSRIVFISDRDGSEDVWTVAADGSDAKQISKEKGSVEFASPSFSSDGQHVVVSRTNWGLRTFEVWAYHVNGGKGVQITKSKANGNTPAAQRHNALGPQYSPDGRYLYYARKQGGFGYNLTLPQWQIARRDLRDPTEDIITAALGSAMRPVLSPDGQLMVYATRHEQKTALRLRNLATGEDRWLAYPVARDEQESRFTRDLFPGYAFAADGEHLFFPAGGRVHKLNIETGEQSLVPITVEIDQTLAPLLHFPRRIATGPVKARLLQHVELSPDGKRATFSAFGVIHVHDLASGETRALTDTDGQAYHPTWSPNGRHIAYVTWAEGGGHIWRVAARGGRTRQLTEQPGYYTDPAYDPRNDRIVALRGSAFERQYRESDFGAPVGSEVVWLPANGGATNLVLPAKGLTQPHFGPESDRIYLYLSGGPFPRSGKTHLVSVRYDGSDRRNEIGATGAGIYGSEGEVPAEDIRISPDGNRALVLHAKQLYALERVGVHVPNVTNSLASPTLPQLKITDVGADHFGWTKSGEEIYWSVGHTVFTRPVASLQYDDEEDDDKKGDGKKGEGKKDEESDAGDEVGTHGEVAAEDTADKKDNGQKKNDDELAEAHEDATAHLIEIYRPRAEPEGAIALTNATILTMVAGEEPVQGTVVIERNRIAAVGDVQIPEGAHVIDVAGKFVLPGYVDTHAHYRPRREIFDRANAAFLASLAYGVTTGIDVQPSTVDIIAYEDMIDAGLMIGPRALSTGPGVFSNNAFKSEKHAKNVLTRYKAHYGVHNLKAYISGNRQQRQWLAKAAAELKLMPTTEGALDMKLNITHIIDGFSGNEHNFPLLELQDDLVELTAFSEIAYTPTLLVSYGGPWGENAFYVNESPRGDDKLARFMPYQQIAARTLRRPWTHPDEYVYPQLAAEAKKIVDSGGKVGVGAHGQLQGLGYHWELWALASGGFTPMKALEAATRVGAEMIGVSQDIGTVEAGKLADLVVLNSDPREDIRRSNDLNRVIKNGEVFDAATLDREWPDPRPLPPQWWWQNQEPDVTVE